ncbi:MAG: response regulator [bacterium]
MKILLVDDDPDMLLITSMALEKHGGHEVISLGSAVEALRCAERDLPDAIVTDFMMDDLDGLSFLEKLRENAQTMGIPVVFLTGKTDPANVQRLLGLGAKGVIGKPFDPMRISEEVDRILAS